LTLNVGSTIKRGFAPFSTPIKSKLGVVILASANASVPEAAMLIAWAATCAEDGFLTSKANVYVVPDTRVSPVSTVSVNVPELQAPLPCVVPFENIVSPSFPLSMRVMGLTATAFVSPVIVTTAASELPGFCVKFASETIVTVIVFSCPARGLLWPMFFVVKLAEWTFEQQQHNIRTKNTTCKRKEHLIFGRLDWNVDRKKDTNRIVNDTIVNEFCELLWPMLFATKLEAGTIEQQKLDKRGKNMKKNVNGRLAIGRLKWHGTRNFDKCSNVNHVTVQNMDVSMTFFESSPQF
jgi:hypothetical protein